MKNINLNKITYPVKIKQNIFFDQRGFFQEIFLKKKFNLNIKFTAIAKSNNGSFLFEQSVNHKDLLSNKYNPNL